MFEYLYKYTNLYAGTFAYINASEIDFEDDVELVSPQLPATDKNACLVFRYFKNGNSNALLRVLQVMKLFFYECDSFWFGYFFPI